MFIGYEHLRRRLAPKLPQRPFPARIQPVKAIGPGPDRRAGRRCCTAAVRSRRRDRVGDRRRRGAALRSIIHLHATAAHIPYRRALAR